MTGWKKGSCRFSLLLSPFKGAEIPFPTMSPSTMAAKAQPHYRGQALIVFLLTTGNELILSDALEARYFFSRSAGKE